MSKEIVKKNYFFFNLKEERQDKSYDSSKTCQRVLSIPFYFSFLIAVLGIQEVPYF